MQMAANTSGIGTRISSMDLEKKSGTMEVNIKGSTKMLLKKAKENTVGQIKTDTLGNGAITCSMERVFSYGMMIDCILATGKII